MTTPVRPDRVLQIIEDAKDGYMPEPEELIALCRSYLTPLEALAAITPPDETRC